MANQNQTSILLKATADGDKEAAGKLFDLTYQELHDLARHLFSAQPANHTLQSTALVHEAFVKLIRQQEVHWQSRAHFMAVAATAMRQILIDHARARKTAKRGGDAKRMALSESNILVPQGESPLPDLLDLERSLQQLSKLNERQGRIVEMRFFAGMTVEEVAHVIEVSPSTVEGDWRMARSWLRRQLQPELEN